MIKYHKISLLILVMGPSGTSIMQQTTRTGQLISYGSMSRFHLISLLNSFSLLALSCNTLGFGSKNLLYHVTNLLNFFYAFLDKALFLYSWLPTYSNLNEERHMGETLHRSLIRIRIVHWPTFCY